MENIPLKKILVDLEDTEDGCKRIKRLENGSHPLDALSEALAEVDAEYKEKFSKDLFQWGTYWDNSAKDTRPSKVFVLYSMETGEKKPIMRFVLWDRATDKPVPKPSRVPGKNGMRTMARQDSVEHIGNFLDWKKVEKKWAERKLEVRAANSWDVLERAKHELEG